MQIVNVNGDWYIYAEDRNGYYGWYELPIEESPVEVSDEN